MPKFTSTNNKNCKRFFYLESKRVYFSGDFDSGNLEEVEQLGPYEVRILDHRASTNCDRGTTIQPSSAATRRSSIFGLLASQSAESDSILAE